MNEYEEKHEIGSMWSWVLVVLLCAVILAWGLTIHALVKDGPREWNFGTLPDAPSQSIYSTEETPEKAIPPRQVAPLPEAKPGDIVGRQPK
jgi:hypothetical protein